MSRPGLPDSTPCGTATVEAKESALLDLSAAGGTASGGASVGDGATAGSNAGASGNGVTGVGGGRARQRPDKPAVAMASLGGMAFWDFVGEGSKKHGDAATGREDGQVRAPLRQPVFPRVSSERSSLGAPSSPPSLTLPRLLPRPLAAAGSAASPSLTITDGIRPLQPQLPAEVSCR